MSETKSSVGYVAVEQPFGVEPPIVHCPICGQAVVGEDGSIPCEHLEFVYVGAANEFDYLSDSFSSRVSEEALEEISFDNFSEILEQAGYDNKLLALEITYGGMACGPVWYTDVFGFSYEKLGHEND